MAQTSWTEMAAQAEKDGNFEPLPIGEYDVRVDTADAAMLNDKPNIKLRLVVLDGNPNAGKSILNNLFLRKNDGTPNGMFFQGVGALGFPTGHAIWTTLPENELQACAIIAGQLLGKTCHIVVTHRVHNMENRDNVKRMSPIGATIPAPSSGATAAVAAPVTPQQPTAPMAQTANKPVVSAVPAAPAPVAPAPAPVAPAPAPVAPVAPAPVAPVAPAPVAPVAPAPVAPVAPAPAPAPAPVAPVAPAPVVAEAVVPVAPTTGAIAIPETPEPVVPGVDGAAF